MLTSQEHSSSQGTGHNSQTPQDLGSRQDPCHHHDTGETPRVLSNPMLTLTGNLAVTGGPGTFPITAPGIFRTTEIVTMFPADTGKNPGPIQGQGPLPFPKLSTGETWITSPAWNTSETDTNCPALRTDLAPTNLGIGTDTPIRGSQDLSPPEGGTAFSPPLPPTRITSIISMI